MVVVGVIAVGFAFVFVTRVYSSKEVYNMTNSTDISTNDSATVKESLTTETGEKEIPVNMKNKDKDIKENSNKSDSGKQISNSVLDKILVPMDSIVVNLGKVDSKRYLRVHINLEVNNGEIEKKIKDNKVIFRDKLVSYLSSKSIGEISTHDSQFKLRTDIKDILNSELLGSEEAITQVYFSDFIIQ